jgi:hypothetical protein
MKTKLLIFSLLVFSLFSCKKEQPEPLREVRYEVKIAPGNRVDIWCDADTYVCPACGQGQLKYQGSNLEPFVMSNNVEKGGRYRIKVIYVYNFNREYDYQVNVYVNNTLVDNIKVAFNVKNPNGTISFIDSTFQKYKEIELTGIVE